MMVFQDLQSHKVNNTFKTALLSVVCLFLAQPSYAQYGLNAQQKQAQKQISQLHDRRNNSEQGNEPLMYLNGFYTGNNPHLKTQLDLERRLGKEISEGYGYRSVSEPSFPEIKFFKYPAPATLSARIDTILHGVTVSLPPEYDLYGYELRRYMSRIAGPEAMASTERLAAEIANAKRAKIILEYWGKEITGLIDELGAEIEADDNIDSATRTSYRFKSGKAKAFLVEANSWVDNNQAFLEALYAMRGSYEYIDPSINFRDEEDLKEFTRLFRAREKALSFIHAYPPFRMMAY